MNLPDEKYRTIKQCRKFMEELCDPGKTPRVPGPVRDRARMLLKTFPHDADLASVVDNTAAKIKVLK